MEFASDNWAPPVPEVAAALTRFGGGRAPAYGGDDATAEAARLLARFLDREDDPPAVLFTATGTAANALSLAAANRPAGVVLCHADAHVAADEAGAPGFFAHGLRLEPIAGPRGLIPPEALAAHLDAFTDGNRLHRGRPVALSLTQATESGTAYTPDAVRRLSELASARGCLVHMDGARFANAVVHLGVSPADVTWRAGVDLLSLGFTKLGAWCAEAVVAFDRGLADELLFLRKQAGQEFSKMRFLAAQFVGLLEDDAWRRHAAHANAMAARLAEAAGATGRAALAWPSQSNEIFLRMERAVADRVLAAGARFHPWDTPGIDPADRAGPGEGIFRLVCDHATTEAEVDAFAAALAAA